MSEEVKSSPELSHPHNISPELLSLIESAGISIPELATRDSTSICSTTTINFIGALVFSLRQHELLSPTLKAGLAERHTWKVLVPKGVHEPVKMHRDVPLYIHNKQSGISTPANVSAATVLVKYISNRVDSVGVVMEGPYAGLLLREISDLEPEAGMTVNRVYNDQDVTKVLNDPHNPLLLPYTNELNRNLDPILVQEFELLRRKYHDAYIDTLQQFSVQNSGSPIRSLDMMLQLLNSMPHMTVNPSGFHYTLPAARPMDTPLIQRI